MITEKRLYQRGDIVQVRTDTAPRFKYIVTTVNGSTAIVFQLGTGFSRVVPLSDLELSHR